MERKGEWRGRECFVGVSAEEGMGVWRPDLTPKRGSPVMGKRKSHGQGGTGSQKTLIYACPMGPMQVGSLSGAEFSSG